MKHLSRNNNPTSRRFAFLLLACLVVFTANTNYAQRTSPRLRKQASPAVRADMLVSTPWLANHLDDKRVVILHIANERAHYDAGHISGAHFVLWSEITATRDGVPNELPPVEVLQRLFERLGVGDETRIVIYGDNSGLSAARAFFTLDYLGHGQRAALLDGGLEKWKTERRRVSTESPQVKATTFTPRVSPQHVVGIDVVRDLSWTVANTPASQVALIDARPAEEYTGTKPGEGVTRPGHIPGAANVFWIQNVVSRENPVMRSPKELQRLYEAAGATPNKTIVTYCRTGGQASHAYFTLKYLGYDVSMYDGSFYEWSKTEGTPVAAGSK